MDGVTDINAHRTCVVSLACNHPDNGVFRGKVEMAEFEVDGETLVTVSGPDLDCFEHDGSVQVDKRVFRFVHADEHVGNWCWNAYTMAHVNAVALLGVLLANGWGVDEDAGSPLFAPTINYWATQNERLRGLNA